MFWTYAVLIVTPAMSYNGVMGKKVWIISVLLGVNLLFNWGDWQQLISRSADTNLYAMDGKISEFLIETGYQRIIHGQNPFVATNKIFYPFETDVALNDPGMLLVLPYAVFRPWLGVHQAIIGAVILSLLASSMVMYKLLRVLGHRSVVAVLIALIYAYMPFVGREVVEHYTYLCLYLFPLLYLLIYRGITTKDQLSRGWYAAGAGVVVALFWYGNFYYGMSLVMASIIYFLANLIGAHQKTWLWIRSNYLNCLIGLMTMVLVLVPWLVEVKQELIFTGWSKTVGYGGAVQLAEDLVGLVLPSTWGLVLLLILSYTLVRWGKLVVTIRTQLRMPLLAGAWFAILALGPFLKILGHWHINLEGVEVFFPLPFLLVRGLPGLAGLRAPERFIPVAIFFVCLAGAIILKKASKLLIALLMIIFLISQYYVLPQKSSASIPTNLYEAIAKDGDGTVLEIPFGVRDGYRYLGFVYGLNPMEGQLVHGRPIIGGYLARVREPVFTYYERLSWVGHLLNITDQGNYNRFTESPKQPVVTKYSGNIETAKRELDFLNVTDIVMKEGESYSQQIEKMLLAMGAQRMAEDQGYASWKREVKEHDFDTIVFGGPDDYLYAGAGLTIKASQSAEVVDKRIELLLRPAKDKIYTQLYGQVTASEAVKVKIYLDRKIIGESEVGIGDTELRLPLDQLQTSEIVRIELIWDIPKGKAPKIYLKTVGIK